MKTKKQISFDMDTHLLKAYYPKKGWRHAYDDIKNYMLKHGFDWIQGSVYVSKRPISNIAVTKAIIELISVYSWLNICMRDCRVTEVTQIHSLNNLFDKNADIPKRLENDINIPSFSIDDFTM